MSVRLKVRCRRRVSLASFVIIPATATDLCLGPEDPFAQSLPTEARPG
jgi:hypothetical protein